MRTWIVVWEPLPGETVSRMGRVNAEDATLAIYFACAIAEIGVELVTHVGIAKPELPEGTLQ